MNIARPFAGISSLVERASSGLARGQGGLWLSMAGLMAFSAVVLPQAVDPPAAVAYTSRLNLFLTRESDESFEVFLQRAEIVARAAVQRSFDADVLMTDVIVTVVGDTQGVALPILTVDVSRSDWQLRPDIAYWGTYYEAAEWLMNSGM